MNDLNLKYGEKAVYDLRALYEQYGYTQYRMGKFEEYDFYIRNKDYLCSDGVITFTDTNGRLMALKPDVTLSIVRGFRDHPGTVQKVYYNENVYRISKNTKTFRELMQVGLEYMGEINDYAIYEVLLLSAQSLSCISPASVLSISHLGVLNTLLDAFAITGDLRDTIIACIDAKNAHELKSTCQAAELPEQCLGALDALLRAVGPADTVLPMLREQLDGVISPEPLDQLEHIYAALTETLPRNLIRLDFSILNDMKYYNGIVFQGFVEGIPTSVLSGGQYDRLMQKMGKQAGAIGFAVYLDLLENLYRPDHPYDVDAVLLYEEGVELNALNQAVRSLIFGGRTVMALTNLPEKLTCRYLYQFKNGEVTLIESHA